MIEPPPDIDNKYKLLHWVNMQVGEDTTMMSPTEVMRKLTEKGVNAAAVWRLAIKFMGLPPITPEEFEKYWWKYVKP